MSLTFASTWGILTRGAIYGDDWPKEGVTCAKNPIFGRKKIKKNPKILALQASKFLKIGTFFEKIQFFEKNDDFEV